MEGNIEQLFERELRAKSQICPLELVPLPLKAVIVCDGGALPNKIWVNLVEGRAPENRKTTLLNKTYFEMETALRYKQGMEGLSLYPGLN